LNEAGDVAATVATTVVQDTVSGLAPDLSNLPEGLGSGNNLPDVGLGSGNGTIIENINNRPNVVNGTVELSDEAIDQITATAELARECLLNCELTCNGELGYVATLRCNQQCLLSCRQCDPSVTLC